MPEEKTIEPASVPEEAKSTSTDLAPVTVEQPEQGDLPPGVDTRKDTAEPPSTVERGSSVDQLPYLDAKPPTPGASFSQVEISVDPCSFFFN